jgi:hypothetical protein
MDPFATSHFSDDGLRHDLKTRVARDCMSTAVLLTRIVEFDDRMLYRKDGYPSMHAYCIHELHFSEGATYKRINPARAGRRFPVIFVALAAGRVHLSAVVTLAGHLTSGNVDELLEAATHKTRAEIVQLLAQRYPRPDLPERLQALSPLPPGMLPEPDELSPGKVDASTVSLDPPVLGPVNQPLRGNTGAITASIGQVESGPVIQFVPGRADSPAPRPRVTPLAPERFGLQVTLDQETYDLLQTARARVSHQNPSGEILPVLKSALKLFVAHLEKRKFAATTCPRPSRSATASGVDAPASPRHIPAAIKRAVWERDGAQCTFVSDTGKRCPARSMLEYDHIEPVARGGHATVEGIRLLCRVHNQYAAESAFGSGFMSDKRAEAQTRGRRRGNERRRGRARPAASTSARPDPVRGPAVRAPSAPRPARRSSS